MMSTTGAGPVPTPCTSSALPSVQQYGINPAAYPHRIMFIPNIQNCYWIGLGSQACAPNSCSVWINRGSGNIAMDALAHELGEQWRGMTTGLGKAIISGWLVHAKTAGLSTLCRACSV
jgi:hypothetical protein